MPLQNRVDPTGEILAVPERGSMMGNRGGRIHNAQRTLTRRRWAGRAWIICVTCFRNRHRTVMAPNSYTELFFLDEATALAAGHRPCFECRRRDALAFAEAWRKAYGLEIRPRAHEMDTALHNERICEGRAQRTHEAEIGSLPDGIMVSVDGAPHLVRAEHLLRWSFVGYSVSIAKPSRGPVTVHTPSSTVRAIAAGYRPTLHASATT